MKSLIQFCNDKRNDDWQRIKDRDLSAEKGKIYVYVISWRTGKEAKPIDRLGGKDKFGILYIGRQLNSSRISNFWKSATGEAEQHSAGNLYCELGLNRKVRLEQLYFTFIEPSKYLTSKKRKEKDAGNTEAEWIDQYCRRYLEAPPLNRATPEKT